METSNIGVKLCHGKDCKLKLTCERYLLGNHVWDHKHEYTYFDGGWDRELEECDYYVKSDLEIHKN